MSLARTASALLKIEEARARRRTDLAGELAELDANMESLGARLASIEAEIRAGSIQHEDAASVIDDAEALLARMQAQRAELVATFEIEGARNRDIAEGVLLDLLDVLPEVPPDADDEPLTTFDALLNAAVESDDARTRAAIVERAREDIGANLSEQVAQIVAMRSVSPAPPFLAEFVARLEHLIRRNVLSSVRHARADLERGQNTPMVAIDAGRTHHQLVSYLGPRRLEFEQAKGRIEFVTPGQMSLAFDIEAGISDAMMRWLGSLMRGGVMLSHWVALLSMWSEHGRSSIGLWTPTEHIRRLGMTNNSKNRAAAKDAIQTLLASTVVLDAPGTCGRCANLTRLCACAAGPDRKSAGRWEFPIMTRMGRGMDAQNRETGSLILRAEPVIYSGVRLLDADGAPGQPGSNHVHLPREIVRCSPATIALGSIACIRMHWDVPGRQELVGVTSPALVLSREAAFQAAGITLTANDPARATAALTRALEELRGIGFNVGEFAGKIDIRPPPIVRDRLLGVPPRDALPHDPTRDPTTGAELRAWRLGRGWTQKEAAAEFGKSLRTYERWEAAAALPRGAAQKLRAAMAPGEGGSRRPRQRQGRPRKRT